MSGKIVGEIEKLLNEEPNEERVTADSTLRGYANDLEGKLGDAKHEYGNLRDKLPSDIKDEVLRFVKNMVADITR